MRFAILKPIFVLCFGVIYLVGCEETRCREDYHKKVCNGCLELEQKCKSWLETWEFIDHKGFRRQFLVRVGNCSAAPESQDVVYEVRGVRPDGKEEYYYSISDPKKIDGMLYMTLNDGTACWVDYTSLRIKPIRCAVCPLDRDGKEAYRLWKEWRAKQDDCPLHTHVHQLP